MKRTYNGRAGAIAVAWRPVSSSRISLPIEINSLFLITGNLSLWRRKRWGILDRIAPGESDIDKFPCIFPDHQGYSWRDEFATDCFHRHLVSGLQRRPVWIQASPEKFPRFRGVLGVEGRRIRTGDCGFRAQGELQPALFSVARLGGSDSLPIRLSGGRGSVDGKHHGRGQAARSRG